MDVKNDQMLSNKELRVKCFKSINPLRKFLMNGEIKK